MPTDPGTDRQLRNQRTGLSDRDQHPDQRLWGTDGHDQPRQHRFGIDQQVADLGEHAGDNDAEEVARHVPARVLADVGTDARILFVGNQRVKTVGGREVFHRFVTASAVQMR